MAEVQAPPSVFKPITLNWQGKELVIPADGVMGAIFAIENHLTLTEVFEMTDRKKMKMSSIAAAYAAVITYAGVPVSTEEVYKGMFLGGTQARTTEAVLALLQMMVPPEARIAADKATADQALKDLPKNGNRQSRRAASRLSKKPLRSRSSGKSVLETSGDSTPSNSG